MEVVDGGRGRRFGHLVVLPTCKGGGCWFVARVHENRKNPVNIDLQGVVLFPGILCVA